MSAVCSPFCPFLACSRCGYQGWLCQACGQAAEQGEVLCRTCTSTENYTDGMLR